MSKDHPQPPLSDEKLVRDSIIREKTKGIVNAIVTKLHKEFPYITPDHITVLGAIGVAIAALWAALRPQTGAFETAGELGLYGASSSLDALDGALARLLKLLGKKHDSRRGQKIDVGVDRLQELFLALSRMAQAIRRGDKLGALLALGAAITNTLPSLHRAAAEEEGIAPGEGKNVAEVTGSRFGRTILAASTFVPNVGPVNVQNLADLTTLSANLYLTHKRRQLRKKPHAQRVLTEETRQLAHERKKLLVGLAGISAVAAVSLFIALNAQNGRK